MKMFTAPDGVLQIDDAKIIFRNFEGRASKYNRAGDRNFAVRLTDQRDIDRLLADGWNVKIKAPREPGDDPFVYLNIKVKFNARGPRIYLDANGKRVPLDEETCGAIDQLDIRSVDLDIAPYDYEVNGEHGRAAYLRSMCVYQEVDRFARRYAEEEYPEE